MHRPILCKAMTIDVEDCFHADAAGTAHLHDGAPPAPVERDVDMMLSLLDQQQVKATASPWARSRAAIPRWCGRSSPTAMSWPAMAMPTTCPGSSRAPSTGATSSAASTCWKTSAAKPYAATGRPGFSVGPAEGQPCVLFFRTAELDSEQARAPLRRAGAYGAAADPAQPRFPLGPHRQYLPGAAMKRPAPYPAARNSVRSRSWQRQ